jgi:hypothetical protein
MEDEKNRNQKINNDMVHLQSSNTIGMEQEKGGGGMIHAEPDMFFVFVYHLISFPANHHPLKMKIHSFHEVKEHARRVSPWSNNISAQQTPNFTFFSSNCFIGKVECPSSRSNAMRKDWVASFIP